MFSSVTVGPLVCLLNDCERVYFSCIHPQDARIWREKVW